MNLEKIKERLEELESSIEQFEKELEIFQNLHLEGLNNLIELANTYIKKGKSEKLEQNFKLAIKYYSKALRYVNMVQNFHELYRSGLIKADYFRRVKRTANVWGISCIIMICSIFVLFILTDFVFGFPLPLNLLSVTLLVILILSTCVCGTSYILGMVYDQKLIKKRKDISNKITNNNLN